MEGWATGAECNSSDAQLNLKRLSCQRGALAIQTNIADLENDAAAKPAKSGAVSNRQRAERDASAKLP
jgi:hypothetical protein